MGDSAQALYFFKTALLPSSSISFLHSKNVNCRHWQNCEWDTIFQAFLLSTIGFLDFSLTSLHLHITISRVYKCAIGTQIYPNKREINSLNVCSIESNKWWLKSDIYSSKLSESLDTFSNGVNNKSSLFKSNNMFILLPKAYFMQIIALY